MFSGQGSKKSLLMSPLTPMSPKIREGTGDGTFGNIIDKNGNWGEPGESFADADIKSSTAHETVVLVRQKEQ